MTYYFINRDLGLASALLRINGPDANTYLQGQFSQELRIADGEAVYGLWLDQKGKVLADSHIRKQKANDYLVVSFSVTASQLLSRLQSYLIADEVELQNVTQNWMGVLLWGESHESLRPPEGVQVLPSRRAGSGSVQWLVPPNRYEVAMEALKFNSAVPCDWTEVELARLRAGVPSVPRDIGPRDLPNEGGLEEVGISYTKGCYLGQEVMARLKNLGQVRRRLHLVQGDGAPPVPGTVLFQGERQVGECRSGMADGNGFLAMALLALVNLDPSTGLRLSPGSGPGLKIIRRV